MEPLAILALLVIFGFLLSFIFLVLSIIRGTPYEDLLRRK